MDRRHNGLTGGEGGPENPDLSDWRRQYEAIFSNMPVGIAYLTTDMRYIRINPFLEEKLGRRSEEVEGKYCYDTVGMYKDDPTRKGVERICDVCGVRSALDTGRPFKFQRRLRDDFIVENMGVPVKDRSGAVLGAVEIILDVTERALMEERLQQYASNLEHAVDEKTRELRKSRSFLSNVITSTADAMFTLDGSGRINYMNPAAVNMLGHSAECLTGRALAEILSEPDRPLAEGALKSARDRGESVHNLKVVVLGADGSPRHQLMSLAPLAESEESGRFVCICKDITKETVLEREKEEFLAMLTHDLKTPLTSIMGYSSIILGGEMGELSGDVRGAVSGILASAQKMMGLVRNFLSAGRLDAASLPMSPTPVKLEPVLLASVRNMQPLFKDKGLVVAANIAPNLPRVLADEKQMERVIENLLANAVKFSSPGGRIELRAMRCDDGHLQIEVSDTGIGIPESELPMLFEKYYQGSGGTATGGTGLGLYITKSIVEAHQGTITATSVKGEGATFTVRLPQVV